MKNMESGKLKEAIIQGIQAVRRAIPLEMITQPSRKWLMLLLALMAINLLSGCAAMREHEQIHTYNRSFPEGAWIRHF